MPTVPVEQRKWTATHQVSDNAQAEDDGSILKANATTLMFLANVAQANSYIGDDPSGSDDIDTFVLVGFTGKVLSATVQSFTPGFAPTITLYNSATAAVVIGATSVEYSVPADGIYYIAVWGNGGTGDYRLLIGNDSTDGAQSNLLLFGAGSDDVFAGNGSDVVVGGADSDTLRGEDGNDTFVWTFGDGFDLVYGGAETDVQEVNGSVSAEVARLYTSSLGAAGFNINATVELTLLEVEEVEFRGLGGNDRFTVEDLAGTALVDSYITFYGSGGNDSLLGATTTTSLSAFGGAGRDNLVGGIGSDSLKGEIGADTVSGGRGQDFLTGGPGPDRFVFSHVNHSLPGFNADWVYDFSRTQRDRIVLAGIDADQRAGNPGNDVFVFIGGQTFAGYHATHPGIFGMVRFSTGLLQATVDGDMVPELAIKLVAGARPAAVDLVL